MWSSNPRFHGRYGALYIPRCHFPYIAVRYGNDDDDDDDDDDDGDDDDDDDDDDGDDEGEVGCEGGEVGGVGCRYWGRNLFSRGIPQGVSQ